MRIPFPDTRGLHRLFPLALIPGYQLFNLMFQFAGNAQAIVDYDILEVGDPTFKLVEPG